MHESVNRAHASLSNSIVQMSAERTNTLPQLAIASHQRGKVEVVTNSLTNRIECVFPNQAGGLNFIDAVLQHLQMAFIYLYVPSLCTPVLQHFNKSTQNPTHHI